MPYKISDLPHVVTPSRTAAFEGSDASGSPYYTVEDLRAVLGQYWSVNCNSSDFTLTVDAGGATSKDTNFTHALSDPESLFDTVNAQFIPAANTVWYLHAHLRFGSTAINSNVAAAAQCRLAIQKNGTTNVSALIAFQQANNQALATDVTIIVIGNGTDAYTIVAGCTAAVTGTTVVVSGLAQHTWFEAFRIR